MILTTSTLTFELLIDAHEYEKTRTSDVIFWYPTLRNISGFGGGGVWVGSTELLSEGDGLISWLVSTRKESMSARDGSVSPLGWLWTRITALA